MNKLLITGFALAAALSSSNLSAYDLEDNYIGGSNPNDVIGADSVFNTHGLNASLSGSILTVDIFTNFAGHADNSVFPNLTNTAASGWGKGIAYGDLFLSSSTGANGQWDYGFSLDNRWSATGGSARLFALNGADVLTSDDFISYGGYRYGHEIAVDTSAVGISEVSTGSWTVNEAEGSLSFSLDLQGTGLPSGDTMAFSWGMTCANDVIQGEVEVVDTTDVPEPGALGLVGLGLLGTIISRRRRNAT